MLRFVNPLQQHSKINQNKSSLYKMMRMHSSVQRFSPAARHIIESKAINTHGFIGTSKNGIISKEDIILGLKSGRLFSGSSNQLPTSAPIQTVPLPVSSAAAVSGEKNAPVNNNYVDIPSTNMRKVIAKRLTQSKAEVPHCYSSIECEIDAMLAFRSKLKNDLGVNVSVNDVVIKAAALALRDVPEANAQWNASTNSIRSSSAIDISVAVATPTGLITPILTDADKRGLNSINNKVKDLATRARDGKLKPEEYQGGSFTISNLGMFGISEFSAVINPPQACILAVGGGIKRILPPTTAGGKPRVATILTVKLSSDRRVVDERIAALFLQTFKEYIANPMAAQL